MQRNGSANPRLLLILGGALFVMAIVMYHTRDAVTSVAHTWSSSSSQMVFPYDPSNALAYRRHLERTTSVKSQIVHSETLTFDNIYVLSLPNRLDRREQMNKLARALGVRITFVDASFKQEPFIKWIAERAVEVRKERKALMAKARDISEDDIGGLTVGNMWLQQSMDEDGEQPFPPYKDSRFPTAGSWVDVLEQAYSQGKLDTLKPKDPEMNVTESLWDHIERIDGRQVNRGVISTFFGHTRAMKKALENGDKSALILEDDVDLEWDVERLWARMEHRLPSDWDVSFLGHCWGKELMEPAYLHPHLHQSTVPLCLHGYAVTAAGAQKILNLLNNPWTAYQTAVDTAVPSFIRFGLLNAFSVDPPLIIQRKDGPSDIQEGIGSKWRGLLMDSAWERVERDEGVEVEDPVFDPDHLDPATVFRYGRHRCD